MIRKVVFVIFNIIMVLQAIKQHNPFDETQDELPSDKKFDEVNAIMTKYDKAEEQIKWLNSPEYK